MQAHECEIQNRLRQVPHSNHHINKIGVLAFIINYYFIHELKTST